MSPDLILPDGVETDPEAQEVEQTVEQAVAEEVAETGNDPGEDPGTVTEVELPAQLFSCENAQLLLADPREHEGLEQPFVQLTLIGRAVSIDDETGEQTLSEPMAIVTQIDPVLSARMGRDMASFGDKAQTMARKGLIAATPAMAQAIAEQADQVAALRHGRGGRRR